ncbi:MFS transporter [Neobacillus piezotolerans]|uniref:MFS transporter n=1 Tax=Neobacillus piezotolerans TaxID=2259171 RepID=A0A3D8GW23_9BACI|nr:MFS transporter [Neobacillus piezotolerans]RDU38399.1 MFS transporter [Neobacillus piezotolerans]
MKNNMFEVLRNKAFRSLFTAQVFSDLGNWLDFIAIQVVVAYHWNLGEEAIAAVIIVLALPWVVIGPFASVFVERMSKKQVMIATLLLRAVFVAGLFFSPNLYILLMFLLLKSTAGALYDPARQAMIREIVDEEDLPRAVTLSQLSLNSMKIIGPALGAGLISVFGEKSPFLFEIGGFLLGTAFLFLLPSTGDMPLTVDKNKPAVEKPGFKKELAEGIRHIFNVPVLKVSVILTAAALFIIFLYDGLFVFIAKEIGFNGESFGLLVSAVGLGSVVGSILLGSWTRWKSLPVQLMSASALFSGLLIACIGLGGHKVFTLADWGWLSGAFLLGALGASQSVPYGFVLQSETPGHLMARVSAAASALQTFSMLVAPAAGALLAKAIGVPNVLLLAGAATTLLGAGVLSAYLSRRKTVHTKAGA